MYKHYYNQEMTGVAT